MQERRARTSVYVYEFPHARLENVRLNAAQAHVKRVTAPRLFSLLLPHGRPPRSGHVRYEGSGSAVHGLIGTIRSKWIALGLPCPLLIRVVRAIRAV